MPPRRSGPSSVPWMLWLAAASLPALGCAERASSPVDPPALAEGETRQPAPSDPAAVPARVEALYARWRVGHEALGGDHNVPVRLLAVDALAEPAVGAGALALLDLIDGRVVVQAEGLASEDALDVWLVDNRDGGSVLPDEGDGMLRIGRMRLLEDGDEHALEARLDPAVLRSFRVDLVVVTRNDERPDEGGVLHGRVPLFNRIYTEARLAALRGPKSGGPADAARYVPALARLDEAVAHGFYLFTQETFDGNGRTCSTCHRVENNFTIDPAFIATLPDDDPLFVHERDSALAELESPQMLRQLGLIRANVDGFERPARLRAVPSILSIATSINVSAGDCARNPAPPEAECGFPPNVGPYDLRGTPLLFGPLARARVREGLALVESTGWSGDGAPHDGSLLNFAVGAIAQHFTKTLDRVAGVDYRVPTAQEADDLLLFQLALGRQHDIDVTLLTFADPKVQAGADLFNLNPGGCHDDAGEPHCACKLDIMGNPCGIDVPEVPNGAGCAHCHFNASANSDMTALPNVRNRTNLNFDIGTVERPHPLAEAIADEYGEPLPTDCGLGRLDAESFESWCHLRVSWPPYSVNAPCTGLSLPPQDCFWAPGMPKLACDPSCGGPGQPACNGWSKTPDSLVTGQWPLHGRDPAVVLTNPLGWYLDPGSLCDTEPMSVPAPVITAGMPAREVCEQLFRPAEWGADYGQAFCASDADCDAYDRSAPVAVDSSCVQGQCTHVPGCKCVDNTSCRTEQFCFRQEGSPIDGYCLGLETPKTPYDPNNPEHVARAANRVMIEPTPDWPAFARLGSTPDGLLPPGIPGALGEACNPFAFPSECFGPLVCTPGPFNPAAGTCQPDPNWQPEVLSFCEVTRTYPNNELPFGCFPGSPDPACQGCIPYDAALHGDVWGPGTHTHNRVYPPGVPPPCWVDAFDTRHENNCGASNPPYTPGEGMEGFGDGSFTTPPLIEAADTAPFFHNHSAATLEDAILHYTSQAFARAPARFFPTTPVDLAVPRLSDREVSQIAAYLRVLNALQNMSLAQRALAQAWHNPTSQPGDGRLAYADSELEDAVQVLREARVHRRERAKLRRARFHVAQALRQDGGFWDEVAARLHMAMALYHVNTARAAMVDVQLGEGEDWLWTQAHFSPTLEDVIVDSIVDRQPAEEAAFEAALAELLAEEEAAEVDEAD